MTDSQLPALRGCTALTQSNGLGTWSPQPGAEWASLLQRLTGPGGSLDGSGMSQYLRDCQHILGRCSHPLQPLADARTGLVLGQVQSGKTMSFTGVASLARDNGFRLVIVITGTSIQLLDQSATRLRRDLGIEGGARSGWVHVPIQPSAPERNATNALQQQLEMWNDPDAFPHLKKTVLVTVMKNHANLRKLTSILRSVGGMLRGGMGSAPTLVIDDEADQASLNTKVQTNELSTVYSHIRRLRDALPNHTMLQYTATPQAPLLLNIADLLSPDFCKVLDPGSDYVGGRAFFIDNHDLVRAIPSREIVTRDAPAATVPESLLEAMRIFVLGVAYELASPSYETRSMLVHPSAHVAMHAVFVQWVQSALSLWRRLLEQPSDDLDRQELLLDFERSHAELARTVPNLPSFEQMAPRLRQTMLQIRLEEVNAAHGTAPIIQWESSPAWILVGGQALDRGFTVRGLTVSYMPRPLAASGAGNADTLQQRARFFGYKRSYLGFCRIWLEESVKHALTAYVEHEDALRYSLRTFESMDRPLSEWRRRFFLDSSMNPTRTNVIDIDWLESIAGVDPVLLVAPHHDAAVVQENRALVATLRASSGWTELGDRSLTDYQRHSLNSQFGLRGLCERFLTQFRTCALADAERLNARLLQCAELLARDPNAPADVIVMSTGAADRRRRTANEGDELDQFLQGANPAPAGSNRPGYRGDRYICAEDRVTVQIHLLDIQRPDGTTVSEVPTLAIFAPTASDVRVITQDQGSIDA